MCITVSDVKETVRRLCETVIANEVHFCELDSVAGDGDFGMSLSKGFTEVLAQIDTMDDSSFFPLLRGCSMILYEHCGGASGPIWGSGFGAAAATKGQDSLSTADIARMFAQAVDAIQKRGGAKRGDKTLLDALIPATDALRAAAENGQTVQEAFGQAAMEAEKGAEETKDMVASKGRASYLGERSLGSPDAGAAAVALLFKVLLTTRQA
jgi:dihydroxyacetone kinase